MKKEAAVPVRLDSVDGLILYIHEMIRDILNTDILELKLNKSEAEKKSREREALRNAVRRCTLGDGTSRSYVKKTIGVLLNDAFKQGATAPGIIPFEDAGSISVKDKFEYLYCMEEQKGQDDVFRRLCQSYGWAEEVGGDGGYCIEGGDVDNAFAIGVVRVQQETVRSVLIQRIYETLYGYHAADLLITDSSVDGVSGGCGGHTGSFIRAEGQPAPSDSGSSSYDTIYIMYRGRHIRMSFLSFDSQKNLERVVKNLCRNDAKTALCRKTPIVVCSLLDNSRIVAARPPISDSWAFYVRRFTSCPAQDIEALICDRGSHRAIKLLKLLIMSEQNFVISGNQGGGKTTLLKCLVQYIDPRYTIRVAENTFEMNLNNLYPERNIQVLQEREHYTVYDALTVFKKTDCDVTILGEINEPKVAGAFIQIVQNGGRMAISTLHHGTTEKLVDYMRNAMISEFGISDAVIAERQVVDSINFDVHMVRDKSGRHYIERITEIVPCGVSGPGERGQSRELYECRDILLFDIENRCYMVTGTLSEYARERMKNVIGGEMLMEFLTFMKAEAGSV